MTGILNDRPIKQDPRWQSVLARDPRADGSFVYAVRTTGIYCRPSCPSRRAKPANLRFFDTNAAAEAAGFRPCLRCHPTGQSSAEANAGLVVEACRIIDSSDPPPGLNALAARIGLSPWHFHRLFRAKTGLTPAEWAAASRARRMRAGLAEPSGSVTSAICDAGYGSSSRFYEQSDARLGMTPTRLRRGGPGSGIRFAIGESALGALLVAQSERGICEISFGDDPEALLKAFQDRFPEAELKGDDPDFAQLVAQVVGFVEAPGIGIDLPLDIRGTAFQERVWQALRKVKAGETLSYADLAARIGAPKAMRAVAGACAANRLAVAIPCHRVIRNDGGLSGYRWGVERKRALLKSES